MKIRVLILGIGLMLFSCKKEKETVYTNENVVKTDSVNVKKNNVAKTNTFQLETFGFPPEVEGCSCYFAKDKDDFEKEKYLYIDDYGNSAFIKINGKLVKIPMEEGDFDPSNFEKSIENGEYKIKMKGKKLKEVDETMMFEGEMSVENKSGEKFTTTIYGECGC